MKKVFLLVFLSLFISSVAPTMSISATITDLYNTGVNDSGIILSLHAYDLHYSVASSSSIFSSARTWDNSSYAANDVNSRWIGWPTSSNIGVGTYIFKTNFTIESGADLSSVRIDGKIGADNGYTIFLNGTDMGISNTDIVAANYAGLTIFVINSGFTIGINTLEFHVNNGGSGSNPMALRVDDMVGSYTTGDASHVPVPSTVVLLGIGLLGLAGVNRKKNRNNI